MRDTIILTVFNRPWRVLEAVLAALSRNDLEDTEVLVVNDGSSADFAKSYHDNIIDNWPVKWLDYNTLHDLKDACNFNGHNNPAAANNIAIKEAEGDHITFLSSDCIIPPNTLEKARQHDDAMWVPRVVDMDTGIELLSRRRFLPMCWFVRAPRAAVEDYDIEYLKGMELEDNDWTARTALNTGKIVLDESCLIFHQSHPHVAYTDDDGNVPEIPKANKEFLVNEAYTVKKWGGIPWSNTNDPLFRRFLRKGPLWMVQVRRRDVT